MFPVIPSVIRSVRVPSKIELNEFTGLHPHSTSSTLQPLEQSLTHPFRRTQLCDSRRTGRASRKPAAGLAHSCLPGVTSADACCTLVVAVFVCHHGLRVPSPSGCSDVSFTTIYTPSRSSSTTCDDVPGYSRALSVRSDGDEPPSSQGDVASGA